MQPLTFLPEELAEVLGLEVTTLKRLVTEDPGRLPPSIEIGEGARPRRIWLVDTVRLWLVEKEKECEERRFAALFSNCSGTPKAANTRRGPGRPRKIPGWREHHKPALE